MINGSAGRTDTQGMDTNPSRKADMTRTAHTILTEALEALPQLPQDAAGWEHFMTGMSDDGEGVFAYDHDRTGVTLTVRCTPAGRVPEYHRA